MFSPHIAEKMAINIRLSIKYIIAPIMKTSIGLYHLYFSKVLGNVIYSEISLTVIRTYFYLFVYNSYQKHIFHGIFVKIIRWIKSDFSRISVTAKY